MRIAMFSTKSYDRAYFEVANQSYNYEITYYDARLTLETVGLASRHDAVCVFVNDLVDARILQRLKLENIHFVALRCAGFNNVDIKAARDLNISVVRVPAYSPHAVAEHTVGLMLCLNRKLHKSYIRVREGNFSLDGLIGFDMHGRTVGVVGTGKIGEAVCRILHGFGCHLLGYDIRPSATCIQLGLNYVELRELLERSDIVTLHCPLTPQTYHLMNQQSLSWMKSGAMLINTSRGAVIDTRAVIHALKSKHLGSLGIDVYEEESHYFFEDYSTQIITDDVLARLLTFPNVLVTAHQGFLTHEALTRIAEITLSNLHQLHTSRVCENAIT